MYICGLLNCANKDSGASIIHFSEETGEIYDYVAISEERLSRVKFPYYSPVRSIKYCMDALGIEKFEDIDHFVFDWVDSKRLNNSNRSYRKLEIDYIVHKLRIPPEKIMLAGSHHLAHATSTFYPSGFEDAAILIIDGIGSEMETTSLWKGSGNNIEFIERSKFYGLGQLYTTITRHVLGFYTGQEGKTMGLAPYGEHIDNDILQIDARYDGLNVDYSRFIDRLPESNIKQKGLIKCQNPEDVINEYYSRISYEAQLEIEKAMLHLAKYSLEKTGCSKLCLAGGVALNCVTNSMILDMDEVEDIFVQPASSDTGIPFGLALWGYHQKTENPQKINFPNAFTGTSYDKEGIRDLLNKFDIPTREMSNRDIAEVICEENVVGWFAGGSEYGPRALGNRSILADPRNPNMRDIMNVKVKHREKFRPFAPSVLCEKSDEYFKLNGYASPFMLLAPKVYEKAVKEIPAVIHVDETARVQTVTKEANPPYYALISEFDELTGVPVILNTSFNDNGEPIVETPLDALLCFMRTNIDYLVLEGIVVSKEDILEKRNDLVANLTEFRDNELLNSYIEAIEICCESYDPDEMNSYLFQQRAKAEYHSQHKALDDLEDKLSELIADEKSVALITDSDHLELLDRMMIYKHLKPACILQISDEFSSVSSIDCSELAKADVVLVCTYNTAFRIIDLLSEKGITETFTPYSYFSRKLPGGIVMPFRDGSKNKLDKIAEKSNEAQRGRSWDEFFNKLTNDAVNSTISPSDENKKELHKHVEYVV